VIKAPKSTVTTTKKAKGGSNLISRAFIYGINLSAFTTLLEIKYPLQRKKRATQIPPIDVAPLEYLYKKSVFGAVPERT
jgi:hypothetical protein